ncbi:chemotaxis protein methyltransferase CheR [Rhizobium cellulosilyticum]|uniref:Chemotaxis protein methyltransferase n=1 Tax=Aliirhizobium cellulosilyticum TaxID=393664 RepID=A0A7W6TFY5_9HYPH|nr:chemotaxis protein methyltransferase CheR [Rhizobium cellulosilyticum]MBB4412582.1 chemotaxis protein methyltransferase CheR [Rhizobium cellulosilyticum]MBB4447214.1 chemotaxis protein methyltransferase CheR [Rhizobium cellulosilyticum]
MNAALKTQPLDDQLSKRNFEALSKFIYSYSGIKMPLSKSTMLEGRLRRRLRVTGIATFDDYCDYLFNQGGIEREAIYLIDAVTTNKTDFFREPKHFDYMRDVALGDIMRQFSERRLRIWSSACSTGAEPYTLAMVMSDYLQSQAPDRDYFILATDLSTDVLQKAQKGIYSSDMMAPVPPDMMRRYVMRAANAHRQEMRVAPMLRQKVGFARMNLMDAKYPIGDPMHIIFCRNVLIYFDKQTQQQVLTRLCNSLVPGGYLFIGHSETVSGFDLPIRQVANTIFKRI